MTLEQVIDDISQLEKALRAERESSDIPADLRTAVSSAWQLNVVAFAVEYELPYFPAQIRKDSQHVITVEVALAIISAFEESMIQHQVLRPRTIMWRKAQGLGEALAFVATTAKAFWSVLRYVLVQLLLAALDPGKAVSEIDDVLARVTAELQKHGRAFWAGLGIIWKVYNVENFARMVVSVMQSRDKVLKQARKAALQDRGQSRVIRRKIAR